MPVPNRSCLGIGFLRGSESAASLFTPAFSKVFKTFVGPRVFEHAHEDPHTGATDVLFGGKGNGSEAEMAKTVKSWPKGGPSSLQAECENQSVVGVDFLYPMGSKLSTGPKAPGTLPSHHLLRCDWSGKTRPSIVEKKACHPEQDTPATHPVSPGPDLLCLGLLLALPYQSIPILLLLGTSAWPYSAERYNAKAPVFSASSPQIRSVNWGL